jgi:hypothetical protein
VGVGVGVDVGVGSGVGLGVGLGVGVGDGAQAVIKRRAVNAIARIVTPSCFCLVIPFFTLISPLIIELLIKYPGHRIDYSRGEH